MAKGHLRKVHSNGGQALDEGRHSKHAGSEHSHQFVPRGNREEMGPTLKLRTLEFATLEVWMPE